MAVLLSWFSLHLAALLNPKIRSFVKGRKDLVPYLKRERDPQKPLIWMHTASLGEFEQGAPVLEALGRSYPGHQLLVTFFSPSGYEVKKGRTGNTLVAYLPMDTPGQVKAFLDLAQPSIALFVKYEVWPELFRKLRQQGTPTFMLSAIFRPHQAYFKWYGGLLRKALAGVEHFFVQDERSSQMLADLGIERVTVSGDTRFDRVGELLETVAPLPFMEAFTRGRTCLVAGSTWPEDHDLLLPFINKSPATRCFVIAPHKTDAKTIEAIEKGLDRPSVRYSLMEPGSLEKASILIVDTIGLLTRIYRYADLAYVGGGLATGLHNTLEPAVYGIPVLIGPAYEGFREASELVAAGGIAVVHTPGDFDQQCGALMEGPEKRTRMGDINHHYVQANKGASRMIVKGLQPYLEGNGGFL
nr:glycosyltransferase N-terminal domain-containing protein [Robiginitalea marina]